MEVLMILLPISLILAGAFLFLFIMKVRSGDYDDLNTPAQRMLFEDEPINKDTTNINLKQEQGLKK